MIGDNNCNCGIIRVKKGDIVWATLHFPHRRRWSPALVLSSDDLGVAVSFFHPNDVVSPSSSSSYFLESELLPFEDAFPSLVPRHYQCDAPLHSALRLFGQRIISSLRCHCLSGRGSAGSGGRFDPDAVLAFVADAAVSPWVEAPRFVDAVRLVAQIHAFRDYSSIQQKKLYRETRNTGDNMKLHPCSSLGQKMNSITQESVALEPEGKYQIISKEGEENVAITSIRRLKSAVPVPEGNPEHLLKNEILTIIETTTDGKSKLLMHLPELDLHFVVGESLKSETQSLMRLENISNLHMVDIGYGDCSTSISVHSNFQTHFSNYIYTRNCRLPDIETTVCLNRKRRRLDRHTFCHFFPNIGRVQKSKGNLYISKYTRPGITHIKMLEPEESIRKDNQACISSSETDMNFTEEVQNLDLKNQNLTLSNLVLGSQSSHSVNCEVDASSPKIKDISGSNASTFQKRLQINCNADATALKSKRSARIMLSSVDRLVKRKDCHQRVASCSIFNSKVKKQSKPHVSCSFTSLFMLFPKKFNLPSKVQLINKFSVFGLVDSSKTRVSCHNGSAQVAFYQESDAVAAYLYAKKKVQFGWADVRFWLDPFDHKKRGFNCFALTSSSASKPIGPPLKSCLKNSDSSREENRKKHYRVRFTIEK